MRTPSDPSTWLWKLPPQRLNASASACSVCSVVSPRIRDAAAAAENTTTMPVGSNPSYCASLRLNRELSSAPATSAIRNSSPEQPPASSAAASAAGKQRGADVRARRHRIAEVESAAHRGVQLRRRHGRQPVAVDENRSLRRAAGIEKQLAQRQDAVLFGAREGRAGHRQHHAADDALRVGRDRWQVQAGDEFGQGVFELAHG
jgi:hypothetical protein